MENKAKKRSPRKKPATPCEFCAFFVWDDDDECYECEKDLDEDEMLRFLSSENAYCPYYQNGDEYTTVRKQN